MNHDLDNYNELGIEREWQREKIGYQLNKIFIFKWLLIFDCFDLAELEIHFYGIWHFWKWH